MRLTRRAFAGALGIGAVALAGPVAGQGSAAARGRLHIRRYAPAIATDGTDAILSGGAPIGAGRVDEHYHSSLLGVVETIDPLTLEQRFVANGLFPRANHASVWLDDRLWLLGGRTRLGTENRLVAETERIDLETEAIWRGPDLPVALINLMAVTHRGSVFVFGGDFRNPEARRSTVSDRVFECAPPYTEWRERAPMRRALGNCAAVTVGDRVFLIGGYDRAEAHAVTQIYDPAADAWSYGPPPPRVLSAHAGAAIGGRIYTFGDYTEQSSLLALDLASGEWRPLALPFTPRRHVRAVTVGDRVVVAGGNQSSLAPASAAVESYSRSRLEAAFDP